MANLVAGAAGGGRGGGGGDEEDVPDLRFMQGPPKVEPNRSKQWLKGNPNSPLNQDLTFEQRETLFIDFLKSENLSKEERRVNYPVPSELNRQPDNIVAMNNQASILFRSMGRKRRRYYFLRLLLNGYAFGPRIQVPQQYKDQAQVKGVMSSILERIKLLWVQLDIVFKDIADAGGVPVKVPEVLGKPFEELKPKMK